MEIQVKILFIPMRHHRTSLRKWQDLVGYMISMDWMRNQLDDIPFYSHENDMIAVLYQYMPALPLPLPLPVPAENALQTKGPFQIHPSIHHSFIHPTNVSTIRTFPQTYTTPAN